MNKGSGVGVRAATRDDLEAMVEFWWQLMSEHEPRDPGFWGLLPEPRARARFQEYAEKLLDEPEHFFLVAEVKGRAAGFVHGQVLMRPPVFQMDRIGRVVEISVGQGFRRQGVGNALIAALEGKFQNRGLTCMDLMVDANNNPAQALYGSLGFSARELHLLKKL